MEVSFSKKKKKKKIKFKMQFFFKEKKKGLGPVWYMCLKTENCCLKIFVEIRVGEKMY